MALTTAQQTDVLFKKLQGVGDTTTTRQFFEEPYLGRQAVLVSQLWSESGLIPSTAPGGADGIVTGIVKRRIDLVLTAVPGTTNSFYDADMVDIIPFNFGDGSYNYTLKDSTNAAIPFGSGDWLVDTAAGVLTFFGVVPGNMPPKLSFYKYVGIKGIPTTSSKVLLVEGVAPASVASGQLAVYAKVDDKLYTKNNAGIETQVGAGGGAAGGVSYFTDYESETISNVSLIQHTIGGSSTPGYLVITPATDVIYLDMQYLDNISVNEALVCTGVSNVGGITLNTTYFVKTKITANTFTLSATQGGAILDITSVTAPYSLYLGKLTPITQTANTNDFIVGSTAFPVQLTRSLETTSPLYNTTSYKISKTAQAAAGHFFRIGTDKTLDQPVKNGKTFTQTFNYKTSANYVTGDVKIFAYRVGSNIMEAAVGYMNDGTYSNSLAASSTQTATYSYSTTLTTADTAVQLIGFVSSANALAYDIFLDHTLMGELSAIVNSPIITEWQSYTPTFTGLGTTSGVSVRYRRVGDSIQIAGGFVTGTTTAVAAKISLPSGLSIDVAKIPNTSHSVGDILRFTANASTRKRGKLIVSNTDATVLFVSNDDYTTAASPAGGVNGDTFFGPGETVSLQAFNIPIAEWKGTSNVMTTTQAAFATPKFKAFRSTSYATGTGTLDFIGDTIANNQTGIYNSNTGILTPNKTGSWKVSGYVLLQGTKDSSSSYNLRLVRVSDTSIVGVIQTFVPQGSWTSELHLTGSQPIDLVAAVQYKFQVVRGGASNCVVYGDSSGIVSYVAAEYVPDFTVFGLAGAPFEIKTATSAQFTPSASSVFYGLTSNSLTLTEGVWRLFGTTSFDQAAAAGYSYFSSRIYAANGTNSSQPSLLENSTSVQFLTAIQNNNDVGAITAVPYNQQLAEIFIRVLSPITVFSVPYATMTTPANARIIARINAERKQ